MEHNKQTATSPFTSLWRLLTPVKPSNKQITGLVLIILTATLFELALPLYAKYLVDSIMVDTITPLVTTGLVAIILLTALFEFLSALYAGRLGHQTAKRLRQRMVNRMLNATPSIYKNLHSAEISARITNDSNQVKSVLADDLVSLVGGVVSVCSVIVLLFFLDWRLSLVILSCIATGALLIMPIAKRMQGIGNDIQSCQAELIQNKAEWFKNIKLIKAHQAESHVANLAERILLKAYQIGVRETKLNALIGPISNLVLMASLLSLLASSGYFISQGTLTLGTLTAFILYLFGLTFPLIGLGMYFNNLNKAAGAATRLMEIEQYPQEALSNKNFAQALTSLDLKDLAIDLGDHYIDIPTQYQAKKPGLYFLSGPSGAGKSTLMQSLMGFNVVTKGQIKINNEACDLSNLAEIRSICAWVDQEPKLLHATVRENLMLGNDLSLSDDEIIETLKLVQLEGWLTQINFKLDTDINEQNNALSGGEKQRFALARAILRNRPLLLLDEPTSALDRNNENAIMSVIRDLAKTKVILMITHNQKLIAKDDYCFSF